MSHDSPHSMPAPRPVPDEEVQRRKAYLQISHADEERLRRAHALIQRHATPIIDEFYSYLLAHPHTRKILEAPGVLAHLRGVQAAYFERLTHGTYDAAYFEDRIRIGYAHDRIGLTPEWYLGAYHKYLSIVSDVLSREMGRDYQGFYEALVSLTKIIYLDMGLAMDAYIEAGQSRLKERNRQLQELDAQKRLLSDTIVHDLRNPVAGIQGFLGVFKHDLPDLKPAHVAAIDEAERACAMLNQMVDNVLAISRMEEGLLHVTRETVDVRGVVEQVSATLAPFAISRGKAMRTGHAARPLVTQTDGALVQRIVLNLVMNSIRHATGAKFVAIETDVTPDGRVRISVADDGPGIAPEFHAYIFDKYGRPSLRKAGLKLDTGLGLVFCGMAAKELGAKIGLESDAGKGARFSLVL